MLGAVVGLMVGQGDLVPGARTTARSPRSNPAMLATVAAVHSLAFAVPSERACREVASRHPSLLSFPGMRGALTDDPEWSASCPPAVEDFVPWAIPAAWLRPYDWEARVTEMMAFAYPAAGDHLAASLACATAVRGLLDGDGADAVLGALAPFLAEATLPGRAASFSAAHGLRAGLSGGTFLDCFSRYASPGEDGVDRGTAGYVAGAIAGARFEPTGWAYLAAADMVDDDVLDALGAFDALLDDPSLARPTRSVPPAEEAPAPTARRSPASRLSISGLGRILLGRGKR